MSELTRRDFLRTAGLAAGAAFLSPGSLTAFARSPEKKFPYLVLSPSTERSADQKFTLLAAANGRRRKVREFNLPLVNPHSIQRLGANEILVLDKLGPTSCVLHLGTGETRAIAARKNHVFYGHGVFSPNRQYLYTTEVTDGWRGCVSVRDGKTFAILGEIPVPGRNPHDILLLDGGRTIAVNVQEPSSVRFLATADGKQLARTPDDPDLVYGHLTALPDGQILVSSISYTAEARRRRSATYESGRELKELPETAADFTASRILLAKPSGEVRPLAAHDKMQGFTCAVAHPKLPRVAAFFKDGHFFGVWDTGTAKLLHEREFASGERPVSIALTPDAKYFTVLTTERRLHFLDANTLRPAPTRLGELSVRQCIHMTIFKA